MKILKMSQGTPKLNPQFTYFKNVRRDIGVEWTEVKDFKHTHTVDTQNKPSQLYEKTIMGRRKGSTIKQPDWVVNVRFVCLPSTVTDATSGKTSETINIKEASIVLKAYQSNTTIMPWLIKGVPNIQEQIQIVLQQELGMSGKNLETPIDFHKGLQAAEVELQPVDIHGKEGYYYHRLTRVRSQYQASALELYIKKHRFGYTPIYRVQYLELDKDSEERALKSPCQLGDAIHEIDIKVESARKQKQYVGPESPLYIPEGANKENWDFVLHRWKSPAAEQPTSRFIQQAPPDTQTTPPTPTEPVPPVTPEVSQESVPKPKPIIKKPMLDMTKLFGQRQDSGDFGGYFTGEVPDYVGGLVGTPSVDASQIAGMFSGTNDAVSLVNSYTADALNNVAYIFNFSKGGAYGVYIPALDRAIKTKALKAQLEGKGYKIADENGVLTAYPTKEGTTSQQIDQDIQGLWEQLNSQGGSALGINMMDVLEATDQNTSEIINKLKQQNPDIPPQLEPILKNVLGVYHLAAIILHEASHAKGGDEDKAQYDEHSFRQWAQNYLNEQYQSKLSGAGLEEFYAPLELSSKTIHALSESWYKTSQSITGRLNYSPSTSPMHEPRGSDIKGRYQGAWQSEGYAEWAMLMQQDQSVPIEARLNKSTQYPLEEDLDREHDIIEEQLRKQFKNDTKPNTQLITEELLMPERNESQGYKALETMLEELRPQPLMTPLAKAAMKKVARKAGDPCPFGWYNNLDLDDGSSIPGLSDRVMAWDDRDETFSAEEDWIRGQGRYNPSYDLKGFYFRWIDPRLHPQLFDDMTRDFVNTSPAKRFAASLDPSVVKMLEILKTIEDAIINEKIKATRIVVSTELLDIVKRLLDHEGLSLMPYEAGDDLVAIWVHNGKLSNEELDQAEVYFQNMDGSDIYKDVVENILGTNTTVAKAIETVVDTAKELCKEYDVDLYIVGEYARKIFEGNAQPLVSELDFTCSSVDMCLKMGGLMATRLGVSTEHVILGKSGISFAYKGARIFFARSPYYHEVGEKMQEHGYSIESPIMREICNKDFTINMMAYDVRNMKVIDPVGVKSDVKNKIIKTLFDPSFIIDLNPIVIMRALVLKMDGYQLDEDLERSMIENSMCLKERFSPERIQFTKGYVKSRGTDADKLFSEYGLNEEEV